MKLYFIFIFIFFYTNLFGKNEIKIIPPQSKFDTSHKYFFTLLKKALKKNSNYTSITFSKRMEQGRALIELKNNKKIDVYWAGTSIKRQKELRAIKIPLLKGLLGFRVLVINKDDEKKFDNITTINQLKKLTACQGTYWPDTYILENSNFNVIKNTNYESMFLQVSKKRCDYFPRGIHEGYSEVLKRTNEYPSLMLYDKIIIYYPFPMYFFVSKENEFLAEKIQKGLIKMIKDGSFDKHLEQSDITKHIFPIKKWSNKKIFKIENPYLSKEINIYDSKYWIDFYKKD